MTSNELKKISAGLKMFQLDKTQKVNFFARFPTLLKMIGISFSISPQEQFDQLTMIEKLISSQFTQITCEEINYAFQLYISGEIQVPKEFQHYGQVNLKFIGFVLSEYWEIRSAVKANEILQTVPVERQLQGKSEFEQCKEDYLFFLNWSLRENKLVPHGNLVSAFRFLKSTRSIVLSDSDYDKHQEYVRGLITAEGDELTSIQARVDYKRSYRNDSLLFKNRCREEYFKSWIAEKVAEFGFKEFIEFQIEQISNPVAV